MAGRTFRSCYGRVTRWFLLLLFIWTAVEFFLLFDGRDDLPPFSGVELHPAPVRSTTKTHRQRANHRNQISFEYIKFDPFSKDESADLLYGFQRHGFNVSRSRRIPLNRGVPDTRPSSCFPTNYRLDSLPSTTIIVPFHNEELSVLLRTLHSIITRTPIILLSNIVLIDDASTLDYLREKLPIHVDRLNRLLQWRKREIANNKGTDSQQDEALAAIRLIRSSERLGPVRSRQLGLTYALGQVVVFMESRCECNTEWLEPLLARIIEQPSTIVAPQLDIIEPDIMRYVHRPNHVVGAFAWSMQFQWLAMSEEEVRLRTFQAEPITSPTLHGAVIAANKSQLIRLGAWDSAMDAGSDDTLELSFRVWLCGGSLEMIPCSRVGHVFRNAERSLGSISLHNRARVAQRWLDGYKQIFDATVEERYYPLLVNGSSETMTKMTGCNPFHWYLQHVAVRILAPDRNSRHFGDIRHLDSLLCVDSGAERGLLGVWECHEHGGNQLFLMDQSGFIRQGDSCLTVINHELTLTTCMLNANQLWNFNEPSGQLELANTSLCLALPVNRPVLSECKIGDSAQIWQFGLTLHWSAPPLAGDVADKAHRKNILPVA